MSSCFSILITNQQGASYAHNSTIRVGGTDQESKVTLSPM